ncbi:restriction endonuclease subunit S [Thiorhodospira sibirica]|uniref:restriction endonuclease subunit S n=1 Tax=Thiorhodospira sibirica TaxID=154347 RepID=UPI00022C402A|nr:restriction endonuclease subunit S [Thiorhodospira sibirica]
MIPNYSGSLRYFGRIKNGTTPASGEAEYWDGDVRWATPEDLGKLVGDRIALTKRQVTEKAVIENNLNILPVGSVLISTRAPIGHMAITAEPMTFNQGCRGIIPNERVDGAFLYYLLKSRVPELNAVANGTTFVELSRDELAAIQVSFPPLKTQRRIAQFLDEKTARIDGLIEKKRALLDRLAEKRQALITRAVTKGLNPDAPMKPSGINWLGDIPAHWEVKRLRFLLDGGTINGLYKPKDQFAVDGVAFVQMGEAFRGVTFDGGTNDRVLASTSEVEKWGLKEGDFLIARRSLVFEGSGKSVRISHLSEDHLFESSMIRIRPLHAEKISGFLSYYFQSAICRAVILSITKQVTISGIDSQQLRDIWVPVPPLDETSAIWKVCIQSDNEHEAVGERIRESINQLEKYRSALITAAVTGQIGGLQ